MRNEALLGRDSRARNTFSVNTLIAGAFLFGGLSLILILFIYVFNLTPALTSFFTFNPENNLTTNNFTQDEITFIPEVIDTINISANNSEINIPNLNENNEGGNTTTSTKKKKGGGGGGGSSSSTSSLAPTSETNSSLFSSNNTLNNQSISNLTENNMTSNNTQNNNSILNNTSINNNQTQINNTTIINSTNQSNSNNNSNNGNSQNNSNQNNGNSNKRGSPKNIKSGYKLKNGDLELNSNDILEGKFRLKFLKGNKFIADFDVNFSDDIDFGDVIGDSDAVSGKSFFHHPNIQIENISLYIPIKANDSQIRICSNASSFDQIYEGCINEPEITDEYVLNLSSPFVQLSDDGLYFIVSGISGTGGVGEPSGANVTSGIPQTAQADFAGNTTAYAGNVTYLSLSGFTSTQTWQGYFGNVSGVIQLADNSGDVLYNWTTLNPDGEVYASTNSSIRWSNIQCFNYTAAGNFTSEDGNGGTTSRFGVNLSTLETWYGINSDDVDGVNETFTYIGAGTHDLFYSANKEFIEGECRSSRIYNITGPSSNEFEEVLLYEPNTTSVIFASILDKDLRAFNNQTSDFEMLVLDNGHGTDVTATTYYFFVDLN